MTYLIVQMFLCLLIAAAIGFLLGWLLKTWAGDNSASNKAEIADLLAQLALTEKIASDARAKSNELSAKLIETQKETTDAKGLVSDLRLKIDTAEKATADIRSQFLNLQGTLHAVRTEWEAKVSTAETASATLRAELESLKSAVAPVTLATMPPPQPIDADDLKDIVGIGPVLERQLQAAGIMTFRNLAQLTPQGVLELAEKLDHVFGDRISRERWIEQAADLHRKKYGSEP